MSALGLVGAEGPRPESSAKAPAEFRVRLDDTLAAGNRLWVRGRLLCPAEAPNVNGHGWRWWRRWRSKDTHPQPAPTLQLETRVSGSLLTTEVPLQPDGRFEATFTASLPPARRGWRVARNRVIHAGQTTEACNVVLLPPAEPGAAIVVLLPLDATLRTGGAQALATSEAVAPLLELLRQRPQGPGSPHPIYYLACVPEDETNHQVELALAATSLGWPAGHFILMTADRDGAVAAIAQGLDRLRWLFAGSLELLVLNLEPAATAALVSHREAATDRALVRYLLHHPDKACAASSARATALVRRSVRGPRPTRAALLPRYPVVFCHGMLAFSFLRMQLPEDLNCFSPLREFLKARGFRVLFPQVPPTSGVVERAASLKEQIRRWTDEPVNLIAHSMGGLDARYMITHLDMADQVRSLTAVCTPHRGTSLADWFQDNFRQRVPLLLALEAFGVNVDGFRDCRLEICREFNANTPDCPQVKYFSFGGEVLPSRLSPILRRAWNILTPVEGPNDGMVSKASARWGEYLGTIHADHFAQTPDAVFLRPGETFDALEFYSRLVEDLARRGF